MGLEVSVTCVSVWEMGRRQVDKKKRSGNRGNEKIKAFLERMGNFNPLVFFIFAFMSRRCVLIKYTGTAVSCFQTRSWRSQHEKKRGRKKRRLETRGTSAISVCLVRTKQKDYVTQRIVQPFKLNLVRILCVYRFRRKKNYEKNYSSHSQKTGS